MSIATRLQHLAPELHWRRVAEDLADLVQADSDDQRTAVRRRLIDAYNLSREQAQTVLDARDRLSALRDVLDAMEVPEMEAPDAQ